MKIIPHTKPMLFFRIFKPSVLTQFRGGADTRLQFFAKNLQKGAKSIKISSIFLY